MFPELLFLLHLILAFLSSLGELAQLGFLIRSLFLKAFLLKELSLGGVGDLGRHLKLDWLEANLLNLTRLSLIWVAQGAPEGERGELVVGVGRWMGYAEWTVYSTAVAQLNLPLRGHVLIMTSLAHVERPVAEID